MYCEKKKLALRPAQPSNQPELIKSAPAQIIFKGVLAMSAALSLGLLGACLLLAGEAPEIAGQWTDAEWGSVVLKQMTPGEYAGSYTKIAGKAPGRLVLKWTVDAERFDGTWGEGEERFGTLFLKRDGNTLYGSCTTDPQSKIEPAAPRPAEVTWSRGSAQPLDLSRTYRATFERWEKSSFPWRAVPRGPLTLGNVPLDIGGMLPLWGEANAKRNMVYSERADDIPVNRKFETLYVYHATFFTSAEGAPVYDLNLLYADDSPTTITVCFGTHVRDWYQLPNERTSELADPQSKMVWRGEHPDQPPIRLRFFITAIPNPKPALELKSLSLVSAKGNSAGCILAITTGAAGLLKVEPVAGP